MHLTRSGIWLSFDVSDRELSQADTDFLEAIEAVYTSKAKAYRVRYTEPTFQKAVAHIYEYGDTMDATCIALATFDASWSDKLEETVVRSLRSQMKHQKQGVTFLLMYRRAMLGFDMGTGKTKTAVDAAGFLFDNNMADIALVVTDATVVDTWVETLVPEDSDYKAIALTGSRTDRITRLRFGLMNGYKFFVINYDGVPVMDDELSKLLSQRAVLILDESQRVKNHTTKRFKTLWKLHEKHDFDYIFLLSGTPITQSPEDIFGQYSFVDPTLFGHPKNGWYGFRSMYVQTSVYDKHVVTGYRHMDTFLRKFHSRCFRVRTADVVDLPPKVYLPVKLPMPTELAKVYKEYCKSQGFVRVPGHPLQGDRDELYVSTHPFTMLAKSLQIANNFIYLTTEDDDGVETTNVVPLYEDINNPKMDYVEQLLEDTDQQVVLWFYFKAMRQFIEKRLLAKRYSFVTVDGTVPTKHRQAILSQFTSGKKRVLVAQQSTIRTGISLVCSRINVYLERAFSVETRQQSEKRTHRLGMDLEVDNVMYIDLMYDKTAEVTVYDQLRKGVELSGALVDLTNVQLMLTGTWNSK